MRSSRQGARRARDLEGLTPDSTFGVTASVSHAGTFTLPIARVAGNVLSLW